jgi:hypothetical protein
VDDADTDNYNPSVAVSNNIIHVFWSDSDGAGGTDYIEGRRINTASADAQGTLCQQSIGPDTEVDAYDVIGLDGTCTATDAHPGDIPFGSQGAGLTAGDRPVLVGLTSTTAAMVFQDGDLSYAYYDPSRNDWRRNNQTIASVTDNVYAVTTDGTDIWVLSVSGTTATNFYTCCTDDMNETSIDSDTGLISAGVLNTTDVDIVCLTSSDCKLVYVDNYGTAGPDLVFVDCDNESCSSSTSTVIDSDIGNADYRGSPAMYCLTTSTCKIVYGDVMNGNAPDLSMIACTHNACSTRIGPTDINGDLGGAGSEPYASIYCPGSTDCKVVYFEDDTDDLWVVDCSATDCSTTDATTLLGSNINTTNTSARSSIWCPTATTCKVVYHHADNGDLMFVACTNAACSTQEAASPVTIDSDVGGTSVHVPSAIDCTEGATYCKFVYADGSQTELNFVYCNNDADCSTNTITKIDDDAGGGINHSVGLDCRSGASDCKGVYMGEADTTELNFFDCDNSSCSSGSAYYVSIANNAKRGALYCTTLGDCSLIYSEQISLVSAVSFADCDTEDCLPTWTDAADPWTSETAVETVSLTYDSSNDDLYSHIIKDTSDQAYWKSTDATTISWGGETSYGFTAGDLAHISAPETAAGATLRRNSSANNFEFAVVPERLLLFLVVVPFVPGTLRKLKKKKKLSYVRKL